MRSTFILKNLLDNFSKVVYASLMSENHISPAFYTVRQTAQYLNISEKTVRRLIERGFLPTSDVIRKKLIPRKLVETFSFERSC
jgi:excisionase family DNA binding protein